MSDEELLEFMEEEGGGFTPADVATAHHWFDGSDISTLWEESTRVTQASQDSVVGAWDDKITATPFTQPLTNKKPICKLSIGGLSFDGTDFLTAPKLVASWATGAGINARVFAVVTPTAFGANNFIWAVAYARNGWGLRLSSAKAVGVVGDALGGFALGTSVDSALVDTLQLLESEFDNTNDVIRSRIDGVYSGGEAAWAFDSSVYSLDPHAAIGCTAITQISGSNLFSGVIREIFISEEITSQEYANLKTYWNTKYGLSL